MKIHNIEIQNITSLKGKHYIDFQKLLREDDLFAITGATGSGKSSLLSSIALALYGNHYKAALNSSDFVTQGEKEGRIKLEFSVEGKTYTAHWSCQVLKKNGEPKKRPTPLRWLEKDLQACEKRPEEVLPLDFDQFCKVAILNQGQFSRFLNSSYKERKEILEKMISAENLSSFSKVYSIKLNQFSSSLQYLEQQMQNLKSIDKEEHQQHLSRVNFLEKEIRQLKEKIKTLLLIESSLKEKDQIIKGFSKTVTKNLEVSRELEKIVEKYNHNLEKEHLFLKKYEEEREQKNTEHTYLQELKTQLREFELFKKSLSHLEEGLSFKQEQMAKESKRHKQIEKEIFLLEEEVLNFQKLKLPNYAILDQIKSKLEKIRGLQSELKLLTEKLRHTNERTDGLKEDFNRTSHKLTSLKKEIQKLEKNFPLQEEAIAKERDLFQKTLNSCLHLEERLSNEKKQINKSEDELYSLKQKNQEEQKVFSKKKEALEKVRSSLSLYHLINEAIPLVKGKQACPVCDTPIDASHYKKIEQKKEKQKPDLCTEDLEKSLESIKISLLKSQEKATFLEKLIKEGHQRQQNYENEIESLLNSHNIDNIPELQKEALSLEKKYREYREGLFALKEKKNRLHETQIEIHQKQEELNSNQSKYISVNKTLKKMEQEHNTLKQDLEQLAPTYIKGLEYDKLLDDMAKSLKANNATLLKGQKEQEREQVKESLKELRKQSNQQSLLIEQEKTKAIPLKENIEQAKKRSKDYSDISSIDLTIERIELDLDSLEKEKKGLKEEKRALDLDKQKYISLEKSLNDQEQDYRNLYAKTHQKLCQIIQGPQELNYNDRIHDLLGSLAQGEDLDSHHNKDENDYYLENIITPHREELQRYKEERLSEIGQLRARINQYQEQFKKIKTIQKEFKQVSEQKQRYELLSPYLEKDEFRNYVLEKVESELIWQANHELKLLCDGRYELQKPEGHRKTEYLIKDHWQGCQVRKCSTLSGGETFLLSLALALGLAELSKGTAEIDCFFIDEGFGTLDRDCIEEVYEVLIGLRNRGKQIGIISHIKELTEKIPVNILLEKSHAGHSRLTVSNGTYS